MPEASYELGIMYKNGCHPDAPKKRDYAMAAVCFQEALARDALIPETNYEMGMMYFNPTGGFTRNFEKAKQYFESAANMGHSHAQYMLGYMYNYGHLGWDLLQAEKYYRMAADNGHIMSMTDLAVVLQMPETRNYRDAFNYAAKTAKSGNNYSLFVFANLLLNGRGCDPNMRMAKEYYRKAADRGSYEAKIMSRKLDRD